MDMDITSPLLLRDEDELEGSLLPPSYQQGLPVATRIDDETHHDLGDGGSHHGGGHGNNTNQMLNGSTGSTTTPIATATVLPVETFNYDDALTSSVQDDENVNYGEQQHHQQYIIGHPPLAHHVPAGIDDQDFEAPRRSRAIADDSSTTVRQSTHIGVIQSEQEKDAIRRANRKVYSQTYHEQASIETANQIAKLRDREGLEVRHDNTVSSEYVQDTTATPKTEGAHQKQQEQQQQQTKTTNVPPSHRSTAAAAAVAGATGTSSRGRGGYQIREYEIGSYETKSYNVKEYKSVYD